MSEETLAKDIVQTGTVIIGAGPAGLAVASCLERIDEPYEILERGPAVAHSWRHHYDRLHLHTDRNNSRLPHHSWPQGTPRYPSRDQVVAYLESYAARGHLRPRFEREVVSARQKNDRWMTSTSQGERYESRRVVVATGVNGEPNVPAWPGQETFAGTIIHSYQYKNGGPFREKDVLVVGFGNSGGEIAIDLFEHGARPAIAVRSPVNVIPKEVMGRPILSLGIRLAKMPPWLSDTLSWPLMRLTIGDIRKLGLQKLPFGPNTQIRKTSTIPLIDIGTLELIRNGQLRVRRAIERFTPEGVVFDDGRSEGYDAIVLATGYRPRLDRFLDLPADAGILDAEGTPRPELSGKPTPVPGLYLCGFYVSPTGMIREIGIEARRIAHDVVLQRRASDEA